MGRKHWLRDGHEHVFLQSRQCGWICVTFSAFCSHWALRFPAWLLQDLLNNKYMCSHICFNHHSQMFLLRQTFPLCCLLKRRKFWHVWCSCIGSVCVCVCTSCWVMSNSLWTLGCSLPGSPVHGIPQARKNTRVGSCSLPRDLPNPGMEPRSPTLKVDLSHQGSQ